MDTTIKDITVQALSLTPKSRAILADTLLDSLEEVKVTNIDKLWISEAKRRDREITEGKVNCRTHKEIMEAALKAIQCK